MSSQLREIKSQTSEHASRRWFNSPEADLYWWNDGQLARFEFCYGKGFDEHSLRWQYSHPLTCNRILDGESSPLRNASPVLS